MEQSAGTDVFLSLFGGLCSQTASPLLLCIWLARMAKGKGYKCRVGASLHFLSLVSTSGRFLLAIVLHSVVSLYRAVSFDRKRLKQLLTVDLCTSRYVYVYCMYVVCPQTADIRGARECLAFLASGSDPTIQLYA